MKLKSKTSDPFNLAFLGEGCGVHTPLGNPTLILRSRHSSGIMPSYLLHLAGAIENMKLLAVSVFTPKNELDVINGEGSSFVVFTVENNGPSIRNQDGFLNTCLRKIFKRWKDEKRRQTHLFIGT